MKSSTPNFGSHNFVESAHHYMNRPFFSTPLITLSILISLSAFLHAQTKPELLFGNTLTGALDAEQAKGDPMVRTGSARITNEGAEIGLDENPAQYRTLTYAREGNLKLAEGTLEFWFRPRERHDEPEHLRYLFDLPTSCVDSEGNHQRVVIALTDEHGRSFIRAFFGPTGREGEMVAPISWQPDEWHHVALTWDKQVVRLFLDGQMAAQKPTAGGLFDGHQEAIDGISEFFVVGGLMNASIERSARGTMRQLKIYDHPIYTDGFEPEPLKVP